jgi:hypothetical protein
MLIHSQRVTETMSCVFLMVCVARSSSLRSSVAGIELAPGLPPGVAIWVCSVILAIHRSALHPAGHTLFEG